MRRLTALTFAGLLVVTSCGGGDDSTSGATFGVVDLAQLVDSQVLDAVDDAVERLGSERAAIAVLVAMDLGYTGRQILDGLGDGTLEASGDITGVTPAGPFVGFIGRDSAAGHDFVLAVGNGPVALQAGDRPQRGDTANEWACGLATEFDALISGTDSRRECDLAEQGKTFIGLIVMLQVAGYSGEQIIETFSLGGDLVIIDPTDFGSSGGGACIALDDGADVIPPVTVSDELQSATCREAYEHLRAGGGDDQTTLGTDDPAEPDDPSAAAGEGDYAYVAEIVSTDTGVQIVWEGAFSIVDGTVVGSGVFVSVADSTCSTGDGPEHTVAYTAEGTFSIQGSADDTTISIETISNGGTFDLITGDTTQLCVELAVELGQAFVDADLGTEESGFVIEVPASGGETSIDVGLGTPITVTVDAG